MKKRLVLVFAASALLALAGCGKSTTSSAASSAEQSSAASSAESSVVASSSSNPSVVLTALSITNKTTLQGAWYVGQSPRYITLSTDPVVNVAALLASGELKVTSSDATIISVQGLYVSAVSEGTATITVALGGKTDTVEISTHDIANVTTNKISDIADEKTNYKIIGKITAVLNSTTYFIDDGTGAVEVYGNSSVTPSVGKNVVVYGTVSAFHNLYEYGSKALVLESKDTVTPQDSTTPVELTSTILKSWTALKAPDLVKTKGVYKFTGIQNHAGNYAAFSIGGIAVEPSGTDTYKDGHTYSVVCYFAGSASSYVNVGVISIKDETKVLASASATNILVNETSQITATDATDAKATFTYASDKTDVATVDTTGKVTAVAAGTAKITVTSSTTYTVDVTINVCAAVKANAITANGNYQVIGKVTCVTTKGYIVDDGTAGVSVYLGAKPTVKLNDLLSVTGVVTNYNNVFQFGSSATAKTVTTEVTPTVAADLTDTVVAGWKALTAPIVSGSLYKAVVTDGKDGDYDVFDFNGINVEPNYSSFTLTKGKQYTITGYFGGYNSKYGYAAFYLTSAVEYIPDVGITADKAVIAVSATSSLKAVDNTVTTAVTWTWTSDKESIATVAADATDSSVATVTGVAIGTAVITATSSSGKMGTLTITVGVPATVGSTTIADLLAKGKTDDYTVVKVGGIFAETHGTAKYGNGYLVDPSTGDSILIYGCTKTATGLVKTDSGKGYYTGAFTNPGDFDTKGVTVGSYVEMEVIYKGSYSPEIMGVVTSEVLATDTAYTYKYTASAETPTNGTVALSKSADLAFGDAVTITATPATGYVVDTVVVDHGFAKDTLTAVSGVYSFAANVVNKVSVTFKDPNAKATSFTLNSDSFGLTAVYSDYTDIAADVNGTNIKLQGKQLYLGSGPTIQMRYKNSVGGQMYNTVAVPGSITSIVVTLSAAYSSTILTVSGGTAAITDGVSATAIAVADSGWDSAKKVYTLTFQESAGITFFNVAHSTTSGGLNISSIVVNFTPAA